MNEYIIVDLAGNILFGGMPFSSEAEAHWFLRRHYGAAYFAAVHQLEIVSIHEKGNGCAKCNG